MTPQQLAKTDTEAAHQTAFFAWCAMAHKIGFHLANQWAEGKKVTIDQNNQPLVPCLKWIHHIPNGGSRGDNDRSQQIRGAQLKAQGVREGIPDIFLPYASQGYLGLYIEMKKPSLKPKREGSKGGMSDDQIEFREYAVEQGFRHETCYSWIEATNVVIDYLTEE